MSEEQTTFSGEHDGLAKAAAELTEAREAGVAVSAEQPAPAEAEPPIERRWETEARDDGREKPALELGRDRGLDERDAAKALAERRQLERLVSAGDEQLQRELEAAAEPPVEETERNEHAARMEDERIKCLEAQAAEREQERVRAAANAAHRAQVLAQQAENELLQNDRVLAGWVTEQFPWCQSPLARAEMAKTNPVEFSRFEQTLNQAAQKYRNRYASAENAVKRAADEAIAAHVTNHERQGHKWDLEFDSRHPEKTKYPQRAQQIFAEAIELLKSDGHSEEDIRRGWYQGLGPLAHIRQLSEQEAIYARATKSVAKKELVAGKANARQLRPVMRPGAGRDPRAGESISLAEMSAKLDKSGALRDAARFLAASRRGRA